jgi:hypothetical protein
VFSKSSTSAAWLKPPGIPFQLIFSWAVVQAGSANAEPLGEVDAGGSVVMMAAETAGVSSLPHAASRAAAVRIVTGNPKWK